MGRVTNNFILSRMSLFYSQNTKMKTNKCKWCGTEIITNNPRRFYCDNKCQQRFFKHKKPRDEVFKPKICTYCLTEFKYTEHNKRNFVNMKTCGSEECKKKARYAKLPAKNSPGYEHFRKRREKINKGMRGWKKKEKEKAYKILGNTCVICGYNIQDVLEPHHIKGRDRNYRDNIGDLRRALKKGTLKEEFILLCPNHHHIHHYLKIPIEELYKYTLVNPYLNTNNF